MSWHPLTFVIKRHTTVYFPNILYVSKTGRKPIFSERSTLGGT